MSEESGTGAAQTNNEPDAAAAQAAEERRREEASKQMKQEVKENWMDLVAARPDSLPRKRHSKTLAAEKATTLIVESILMDLWRQSEHKEPWHLNCLAYAGIEAIDRAAQQKRGESREIEVSVLTYSKDIGCPL